MSTVKIGEKATKPAPVMNYPANSERSKQARVLENDTAEKKEKIKHEKVIQGSAIVRKKSFAKKLFERFVGEDVENVGAYVLDDVLVPAIKNTISELVTGALEMTLFGETRSRNRHLSNSNGKSHVSYTAYYDKNKGGQTQKKAVYNANKRGIHKLDDIIIATRGEAEAVLDHLVDLTIDYNQATIADLYDSIGITSTYQDEHFGWLELSQASISRVRDGWLLLLPEVVRL